MSVHGLLAISRVCDVAFFRVMMLVLLQTSKCDFHLGGINGMSHIAPLIMTLGICPSKLVVCPEINSAINLVNYPIYLYLPCPHCEAHTESDVALTLGGDSHGINMRGRAETPTLAVCRLAFGVG